MSFYSRMGKMIVRQRSDEVYFIVKVYKRKKEKLRTPQRRLKSEILSYFTQITMKYNKRHFVKILSATLCFTRVQYSK